MHSRRFLVFLALAMLAAVSGPPAAASGSGAASLSVNFSVEPADASRTIFFCRAEISDLVSGASFGTLYLRVTPARETTGTLDRRPGEEITVTAGVGEGGTSASYFVEYRRLGQLIARQQGRLSLAREPTK